MGMVVTMRKKFGEPKTWGEQTNKNKVKKDQFCPEKKTHTHTDTHRHTDTHTHKPKLASRTRSAP